MSTSKIDSFTKQYRFLSNFFTSPIQFDGRTYPSVEHAYQAAKTDDEEEIEKVRTASTPGKAKFFGSTVTLRGDWEDVKEDIMKILIRRKFENPVLRKKLLETGNAELIEGNNWGDTFWGVCNGKGYNRLGMILMDVRDELRDADE